MPTGILFSPSANHVQSVEKMTKLRIEIAKDTERIQKDQRAELENKVCEMHHKWQKAEKVSTAWQDHRHAEQHSVC